MAIETELRFVREDVTELKDSVKEFIICAQKEHESFAKKDRVEALEQEVHSHGVTLAKWGGSIAAILVLVQLFIHFILGG